MKCCRENPLKKMIISCKESRIEKNKRFYGCFYLGGFSSDSGQSLTVANALRRTLLSDCTGLAIISVQIANVSHEYSTLPGVRESVLDIILSLKEILFKKIKNPLTGFHGYKKKGISSLYEQAGTTFFKPVVGYLKVKGPGVIRAKDLRLPPFLQCVEPSHYIATLAEDGFLNLKCVIMEGKGYYIQKGRHENTIQFDKDYVSSNCPNTRLITNQFVQNATPIDLTKSSFLEVDNLKKVKGKKKKTTFLDTRGPEEGQSEAIQMKNEVLQEEDQIPEGEEDVSQTLKKKRQNVLKELKKIINLGKEECISSEEGVYTPKPFSKEKRFSNHNSLFEKKEKLSSLTKERTKPLSIDAVFNPITKVNYIIEDIENSRVEKAYENVKTIENFTTFLDSSLFLKTNFPYFHPIIENSQKNTIRKGREEKEEREEREENDVLREEKNRVKKQAIARDCFHYITSLSNTDLKSLCTSEGKSHYKGIGLSLFSPELQFKEQRSKDIFDSDSFEANESNEFNVHFLKRQIILLEIWTNGSIHPREALTMAFKNLASTFHIDQIKIENPFFQFSASYKKRIEREN